MRNFNVFEQREGVVVYMQKVTAATAVDALRIAKQKGYCAPIIGDSHD
jgi:hypothetical protein